MVAGLKGTQEKDVLVGAIFEIDLPAQLRLLELVWRSRGKELPAGLAQVGPREGEFLWDALSALRTDNAEGYEAAMTARAVSPHTLKKTGMPRRPVSMRRVSARMPPPHRLKASLARETVSLGGQTLSWSDV